MAAGGVCARVVIKENREQLGLTEGARREDDSLCGERAPRLDRQIAHNGVLDGDIAVWEVFDGVEVFAKDMDAVRKGRDFDDIAVAVLWSGHGGYSGYGGAASAVTPIAKVMIVVFITASCRG